MSIDLPEQCVPIALLSLSRLYIGEDKTTPFSIRVQLSKRANNKTKSCFECRRWSEVTRKVEFWVEVQELGDSGGYESVEVTPQRDVLTGGVYQLRQGQQRRILCKVKPVPNSGTLPIICQVRTLYLFYSHA